MDEIVGLKEEDLKAAKKARRELAKVRSKEKALVQRTFENCLVCVENTMNQVVSKDFQALLKKNHSPTTRGYVRRLHTHLRKVRDDCIQTVIGVKKDAEEKYADK